MLYVIRHGQTDANKNGIVQGILDIELNQTGREQAKEAAKKIEGKHFDTIFCSPLKRTVETMQIATSGTTSANGVIFDDRIKERHFGIYEGTKREAVDFDVFWERNGEFDLNCGETIKVMVARIVDFLLFLEANYKDKEVLLVTHGGVIMIILEFFLGPPKSGNYMEYLKGNAEVLCFDWKKKFEREDYTV